MKTLSINSQLLKAYETRTETFDGKEYLVVPVVMIKEGVMVGSRGPMLQLAEEFGKVPDAWNGIPVTIHHPQDKKKNFISANSPAVLNSWAVGKVFNTLLDDIKLRSEAWLEVIKLTTLSPDTLIAVTNGTILEVSVGSFTDEDITPGEYMGTKYNAIARNHRPDHLALLPGAVGACSVEEGCGIRVNQSSLKKGGTNVNALTAFQVLRDNGYSVPVIQDNSEQGLEEKLDELRDLVRSLTPNSNINTQNSEYNYLKEAFDSYLIYETEKSSSGKYKTKYYKRNYQFNVTTGEAEFTSDPLEVEKKVEYKAVTANIFVRTKFNNNQKEEEQRMDKVPCTPCIKTRVDTLITNGRFCEDDREYLETLTEVRLDKFLVPEAVPQVNTQVTKETALNALKGSLNADEFLSLAPADLQEQMRTGLALHQSQKASMVAEIVANTGTIYTAEELQAKTFNDLQKLHAATVKKSAELGALTYFGLNPVQVPQVNSKEVEPMLPIV